MSERAPAAAAPAADTPAAKRARGSLGGWLAAPPAAPRASTDLAEESRRVLLQQQYTYEHTAQQAAEREGRHLATALAEAGDKSVSLSEVYLAALVFQGKSLPPPPSGGYDRSAVREGFAARALAHLEPAEELVHKPPAKKKQSTYDRSAFQRSWLKPDKYGNWLKATACSCMPGMPRTTVHPSSRRRSPLKPGIPRSDLRPRRRPRVLRRRHHQRVLRVLRNCAQGVHRQGLALQLRRRGRRRREVAH
jgi:hypothetical protein